MHHVGLVEAGEVNRPTTFTYMNIRGLGQRIQQFVGGVGGENGRTVVIARFAAHGIVIGIDRVETHSRTRLRQSADDRRFFPADPALL